MKKNICIVMVFFSFIIHPLYGQERIEHLIPKLVEASGVSEVCVNQGNRLSGSLYRTYSLKINEVPCSRLSKNLLDSLILILKEEMAQAKESDHYEKHMADHDSVTFVVAYGDKSQSFVTPNDIPTTLHSYYAFYCTAILVLADNVMTFLFNKREPLDNTDPFYDKPLQEKVSQVAMMKGVRKQQVKRIRIGNAEHGSGEETLTQYVVPKEGAQAVFHDFNQLIKEYGQVSKQRFYIIQKKTMASILFGEDFDNTGYEIVLTPEQTVVITVLPKAQHNPTSF